MLLYVQCGRRYTKQKEDRTTQIWFEQIIDWNIDIYSVNLSTRTCRPVNSSTEHIWFEQKIDWNIDMYSGNLSTRTCRQVLVDRLTTLQNTILYYRRSACKMHVIIEQLKTRKTMLGPTMCKLGDAIYPTCAPWPFVCHLGLIWVITTRGLPVNCVNPITRLEFTLNTDCN